MSTRKRPTSSNSQKEENTTTVKKLEDQAAAKKRKSSMDPMNEVKIHDWLTKESNELTNSMVIGKIALHIKPHSPDKDTLPKVLELRLMDETGLLPVKTTTPSMMAQFEDYKIGDVVAIAKPKVNFNDFEHHKEVFLDESSHFKKAPAERGPSPSPSQLNLPQGLNGVENKAVIDCQLFVVAIDPTKYTLRNRQSRFRELWEVEFESGEKTRLTFFKDYTNEQQFTKLAIKPGKFYTFWNVAKNEFQSTPKSDTIVNLNATRTTWIDEPLHEMEESTAAFLQRHPSLQTSAGHVDHKAQGNDEEEEEDEPNFGF